MSTNAEYAVRKFNNRLDAVNPLSRHIVDVDCVFDAGKFIVKNLPESLPPLFTIRFTAPANYVEGNVIVVADKELPVRTPGMADASTGLYSEGAVMHCDIDLDRELAFFWFGDGLGGLPNLSYDEQFAGYYAENGRKVYFKTIDLGAYPGKNDKTDITKEVPLDIANMDELIDMKVRTLNQVKNMMAIGGFTYSVNFSQNAPLASARFLVTDRSSLTINIGNWDPRPAQCVGKATLYYTCTDR